MAQLTIDLPADLDAKFRERIADAGYTDAQEYLHDLIEIDVKMVGLKPPDRVCVRTQEELEQKLVEGLNGSCPSIEITAADWAERRRRLTEKFSKRAEL